MSTLLGALVGFACLSPLIISITTVIVVDDVNDNWGGSSLLLHLLLVALLVVSTSTLALAAARVGPPAATDGDADTADKAAEEPCEGVGTTRAAVVAAGSRISGSLSRVIDAGVATAFFCVNITVTCGEICVAA